MAATNDSLLVTQFVRSARKDEFRDLGRGRIRRQAASLREMSRAFMQSRGGGGWKVSRVHAVRR